MPVALYMDAHVPRVITLGLRMRGVDVLTAREDGAETFSDPALLDRATHPTGSGDLHLRRRSPRGGNKKTA